MTTMYTFREIRRAILEATPPSGFTFGQINPAAAFRALRAAPHLQGVLTEMRDWAAQIPQQPIPQLTFSLWDHFQADGSRLEYEQPYFTRRGQLLALVLTAVIDETDAPLPALHDLLWAICDEFSWCLPAHIANGYQPDGSGRLPPEQVVDLFAAETANALAETLALLGPRLNPWVVDRVRRAVEHRIFRPLFENAVHFHWESAPMNWASVCAGAAGMAALVLEPNRERLAGMVERCLRAMECFLESYGADGGCPEGIGYWQYGFGYYVYFVEMLYEYTGGRLDLLQGEQMRRIASFPAAISLGNGHFVNYSDGDSRIDLFTGLLSRLAQRTGATMPPISHVPSFHTDPCYRWAHVTRHLLWTDPAILGQSVPSGTVVLSDLNWVIDRRQIGEKLLAFSTRGGHNDEPHNQNDLGHFLLAIDGESLLADLGAGVYTREYFGPQRYEHLHNSSLGHSLPVIDGQLQQAGRDFQATLLACAPKPDGVDVALDLTQAYALETLRHFERQFVWRVNPETNRATLLLTDRFICDAAPATLEEMLISLSPLEITEGRVVWQGTQGRLVLHYDPKRLSLVLETIPSRNHDNLPITVQRLRLQIREPQAEEEVRLAFSIEVQ